ncbi:TPA: lipoprotein [Salmonella enterica subsp. enterica serovar Infantis]
MRKIISVIVLAASLAGCATSQYGSFVKSSPAVFDQKMATDTVTQLVKLYPPATTRLELQQATPDTFGIALVNNLRAQGYAVMEYKPVAASATPASATAVDGKSAVQPAQSTLPGYPLRYVLDQFSGTNMYRVTVLVGSQSLTRAYTAQNDTVLPAGAWVRKE